MISYVIHTPDGTIRAVVTGSREIAEANVREGETLLVHDGYVTAAKHRVEGGRVVDAT